MNYTIEQLVQKPFWKHFYSISQIPRPSGHMQAITAYIEEFGKALQLETIRDGANNILIRKSASAGYEDCRSIILQSHLDMVPQKNESIQHDFYTGPTCLYLAPSYPFSPPLSPLPPGQSPRWQS